MMLNELAHPALVDESTFNSVQGMRAIRKTRGGGTRIYRLAGLVMCGRCGRRFDAHCVNSRAGYRCRHGHTSAQPSPGMKNTYVREDHLLEGLRARLPDDTRGDDASLADYLRTNGLVVVHYGSSWTIKRSEPARAQMSRRSSGMQLPLPIS